MPISRLFLVPLLIAGTLPCLAQPASAKQPSQPNLSEPSPLIVTPGAVAPSIRQLKQRSSSQTSGMASGRACYSIRDYRFATNSKSAMPKLKKYSTCESALLFHLREVTVAPR